MLYLQLEGGRVVFELAPLFAPNHIANIRKLVADEYFDGLAITFSNLVEARRYRSEEWFVDATDRIEVCNIPLPYRSTDWL